MRRHTWITALMACALACGAWACDDGETTEPGADQTAQPDASLPDASSPADTAMPDATSAPDATTPAPDILVPTETGLCTNGLDDDANGLTDCADPACTADSACQITPTGNELEDDFAGDGPLVDYTTNNESAVPDVARVDGRYRALITDNTNDITLHFNQDQGRLDAKLVSFPFEVIARNIGIGTPADSQVAPAGSGSLYIFAGVQVHVPDLDARNSSHVVIGHRGSTYFTIEGKHTVDGNSSVNDDGANVLPDGRGDIRIQGNADHTLTVSYQVPNPNPGVQPDNWTLYRGSGELPGSTPAYGDQVYVGLITYAFGSAGIPFVGTCDGLEGGSL